MRHECQQWTDTEDLEEEGSRWNTKSKESKVEMNLGYLRKRKKTCVKFYITRVNMLDKG